MMEMRSIRTLKSIFLTVNTALAVALIAQHARAHATGAQVKHQQPQPPTPQVNLRTTTTTTPATTKAATATATATTATKTTTTYKATSEDRGGSPETSALVYLQRYGYMQPPADPSNNHLISEESFSSAVAEFQQFAGLPATGLADNQTLAMMRLPRCGNSDKQPPTGLAPLVRLARSRRLKRYALQGSKWRRQELTYRISQYPTKFANGGRRREVETQIERAFGIWSQVAPIDFVVKREGRVHIDIRFASGDHGDGDAFDGPGNTLAHAYFPQYGGDAHFDDQEYWTVDSYAGTNIFQVAAHELGHSLGLGHSNVREALMAPFYQKYKPNFKLHLDDVLAIQALYGEKADRAAGSGFDTPTSTTSTTTTEASTTATMTTTPGPTTTELPPTLAGRPHPPIYKGKRRPALGRGGGGDDEEGTRTTTAAPGDPADGVGPVNGVEGDEGATTAPADLCSDSALNAITRTEDGNTYAFKGDYYWLLTNEGLARGYPRPIAADWHGLPGHLDAALTWADGKTFFFKGNKYWRFRNRRRDLGYPKLISAGFAGIPDDVGAAFVWSGNGRTYFLKGNQYWRFDSKAEPPVAAEYPRPMKVWLGVPSHVDAAFKWENNVTYFFKGNQYWRFNDREFKVEARGRPGFPRPTAEWWFGCVNSNLAQRAMPRGAPSAPGASHLVRASLQQAGGPPPPTTSGGTSDDWALLGSLAGESAPRPLGTHISDHHHHHHQHHHSAQPADDAGQQPESTQEGEREASPEPPGGERAAGGWRAAQEPSDGDLAASLDRRLGALPPPGPAFAGDLGPALRPGLWGPAAATSSASSSPNSAIFILPHAQAGARLLMFMCTLIATAGTSLASLRARRERA